MLNGRLLPDLDVHSFVLTILYFAIPAGVILGTIVVLTLLFDAGFQGISLGILIVLLVVSGMIRRRGIFLSPWSVRLKSKYRRYRYAGPRRLWDLFKSRNRRSVDIFKGVIMVIFIIILGHIIGMGSVYFINEGIITVGDNLLGTMWQVHAIIIGFSFVALTFAWEEIHNNQLNDSISKIFVEDIGSIWTVTFVFGANLAIGAIALVQPNSGMPNIWAISVTSLLFVASILLVTKRFLDALNLLFYVDIEEEVKKHAKEDLVKDRIENYSTANEVLAKEASGFEEMPIGLPSFRLSQTVISAGDINKSGEITDLNLRRMKKISDIVSRLHGTNIRQNPSVGRSLAEDTTVLALEGEIPEESLEDIQKQLRHGIRTRQN